MVEYEFHRYPGELGFGYYTIHARQARHRKAALIFKTVEKNKMTILWFGTIWTSFWIELIELAGMRCFIAASTPPYKDLTEAVKQLKNFTNALDMYQWEITLTTAPHFFPATHEFVCAAQATIQVYESLIKQQKGLRYMREE